MHLSDVFNRITKCVKYSVSSALSNTCIRNFSIATKLFWIIISFCLCCYCLRRKIYVYNFSRFRTPLKKLLCVRTPSTLKTFRRNVLCAIRKKQSPMRLKTSGGLWKPSAIQSTRKRVKTLE